MLTTIVCRSHNIKSTSCQLETWSLSKGSPACSKKMTLYLSSTTEQAETTPTREAKGQLEGLKILSATVDLSYIRIDSRVFWKNDSDSYHQLPGLDIISEWPSSCFEDIASRGTYLVLTSRKELRANSQPRGRARDRAHQVGGAKDKTSSNLGQDLNTSGCVYCSREPSRDNDNREMAQAEEPSVDEEDSVHSSTPSLSEDSEEWNSADESWSEASTESEPDAEALWKMPDCSDDGYCEDSDSGTESEDESVKSEDETPSVAAFHSYRQLEEDSDSDGRDIDFNCGSDDDPYESESDFNDAYDSSDDIEMNSDAEDDEIRHDISVGWRPMSKSRTRTEKGLLTLYELRAGQPKHIFRFSHPMSVMLYDSPPVIHPTKPLVVWPLCRGEVLFADFEGKTYFIRKARPSTHKSMSVVRYHVSVRWS